MKPCRVRKPSAQWSVRVLPSAAVDLEAGAAGVGGADLEAGGEDDAVDLVLDAVDDQARLGDALDALAAGVDQGDVRRG